MVNSTLAMTHTATLYGTDSRLPIDWQQTIQVRKTKLFYITDTGMRYRLNGVCLGKKPLRFLDPDSVKEISKDEL